MRPVAILTEKMLFRRKGRQGRDTEHRGDEDVLEDVPPTKGYAQMFVDAFIIPEQQESRESADIFVALEKHWFDGIIEPQIVSRDNSIYNYSTDSYEAASALDIHSFASGTFLPMSRSQGNSKSLDDETMLLHDYSLRSLSGEEDSISCVEPVSKDQGPSNHASPLGDLVFVAVPNVPAQDETTTCSQPTNDAVDAVKEHSKTLGGETVSRFLSEVEVDGSHSSEDARASTTSSDTKSTQVGSAKSRLSSLSKLSFFKKSKKTKKRKEKQGKSSIAQQVIIFRASSSQHDEVAATRSNKEESAHSSTIEDKVNAHYDEEAVELKLSTDQDIKQEATEETIQQREGKIQAVDREDIESETLNSPSVQAEASCPSLNTVNARPSTFRFWRRKKSADVACEKVDGGNEEDSILSFMVRTQIYLACHSLTMQTDVESCAILC